MKALLASADAAFTATLLPLLKGMGLQVVQTPDAIQAFIAVQRHIPSVIILDARLPAGSGESVLRSVKTSLKTRHIPVVLMSDNSSLDYCEKMQSLGAAQVYPKPVEPSSFSEGVLQAMGLGAQELTVMRMPEGAARMKILIADDDIVSRRILELTIPKWDFDVISVKNGIAAWEVLHESRPPRIAILDWLMPGMQGIEVCRRLRKRMQEQYTYLLLLTAKGEKEDLIAGLEAGADDYIRKPFDTNELRVRLAAGRRIVELQEDLLATRVALHQHHAVTELQPLSA